MKLVKVTVKKDIANGGYSFLYPDDYDATTIMVEAYEHQVDTAKQGDTEFCYGRAADSFPENDEIVAISQEVYDAAVAAIKAGAA